MDCVFGLSIVLRREVVQLPANLVHRIFGLVKLDLLQSLLQPFFGFSPRPVGLASSRQ